MLLETKAIIQFALLWGSTWVVASLAIAAVLGMALVANFVVRASRIGGRRMVAVLVALLALNALFQSADRARQPRIAESLFYAVLMFQPHPVRRPAVRLGDQTLDIARPRLRHQPARGDGRGVAEYLSLVTGFSVLLGVVALFYVGAVLTRRPLRRGQAPGS